jgi:hypothetical protein
MATKEGSGTVELTRSERFGFWLNAILFVFGIAFFAVGLMHI